MSGALHWIRNIPDLVARHTVIAPDLPGLGESASPPSPHSPESIAEIVAQGIDLHRERFTRNAGRTDVAMSMCGFSFGGMICGLTAERVATQVRQVILIGASGLGGRFDAVRPVQKLPTDASPDELARIHRQNLGIMMLHDPARIDALALLIQATNAPRTRVMSPEHALSDKLAESLRQSRLPVRSIWGENCIFRSDIERRRVLLETICPGAGFRVVPGAGHWAQYEAPGVVNSLLGRWLAS